MLFPVSIYFGKCYSEACSVHLLANAFFFICNQAIKSSSLSENSRRAEELERLRACEGEYATHYDTLSLIGKGSFGFVWTARSKKNHQEVKYFFKILKRNYLGSKQKG